MNNPWHTLEKNTTPGTAMLHDDFWTYFNPGDSILEVGVGTGRIITQCLSKNLKVIGIDINRHELEALKKKYHNNPRVVLLLQNITNSLSTGMRANGAVLLGLLGALSSNAEREQALSNVSDFLNKPAIIGIAEFLYDAKDKVLRQRYEEGQKNGLESGSFHVYDKAGKVQYITHNFEESNLVKLVEKRFRIITLVRKNFISYHGSKRKGITLIAERLS